MKWINIKSLGMNQILPNKVDEVENIVDNAQ